MSFFTFFFIFCLSLVFFFFFFFSSRRRHTRYIGDWSSDVCSSDLPPPSYRRGGRGSYSASCRRRVAPSRPQRGSMFYASSVKQTWTIQMLPGTRSEERRVGKEGRYRG